MAIGWKRVEVLGGAINRLPMGASKPATKEGHDSTADLKHYECGEELKMATFLNRPSHSPLPHEPIKQPSTPTCDCMDCIFTNVVLPQGFCAGMLRKADRDLRQAKKHSASLSRNR